MQNDILYRIHYHIIETLLFLFKFIDIDVNHDHFDFGIVNFPCLDGDIPWFYSYGIYIPQVKLFARLSSYVNAFNDRYEVLCPVLQNLMNLLANVTLKFLS